MGLSEALGRISQIQARFGIRLGPAAPGGSDAAEFNELFSDARRHAGISPTDFGDEASEASPATDPASRASIDAAEVAAAVARLGLGGAGSALTTPRVEP